jgi:DNA gyrase inhibitor GyrI
MYAVVKVRKENAALKITGFFMRVHWQQKSKRRVHAAPIIATFLRELIRSMKDVRYQFRLFQKRVTFIQRRWRTYRR